PILLVYIVWQRGDLPFNWIFFLFGAFILFCGTGHFLEILTLWYPIYWVSGFVKALTAVVSILTAIELFILIPPILKLPSHAQLEATNQALIKEIREREKIESELVKTNQQLKETLTQLQSTKVHLVQSEKMSSLGQMVAGIAHEINNPVNFIYGNLTHAKTYIIDILGFLESYQTHYQPATPEIEEMAEEIEIDFVREDLPKLLQSMTIGAERIRDIVLALRNFSRLDDHEVQVYDIHNGINSTLTILQNRLKAKPESPEIKVIKNYGKLSEIECYPGQLHQVLTNIISNAIDALEEYNLARSRQEIQENPSTIAIATTTDESDSITISIRDNGPGIPENIRQQIFAPFFSTKPVNKGTGLGLSISYQIVVENHGGELLCQSTLLKGTEFIIKLPIKQNSQVQDQTQKTHLDQLLLGF
ncbi:MAG: ATP-binding protein, partial [Jaaginema sp. PMC 1079.18]|nr:ATP-binding protein [Jaaginema sp. PMC 1079.18]